MADPAGTLTDFPEILTHRQLFTTRLDSLREALRRISPSETDQWAAAHLMLGSALRVQAQRTGGSEQAEHYLEAIDAFESAVGVYCRFRLAQRPPVIFPPGCMAANDDPVDIVLAAAQNRHGGEGTALLHTATSAMRVQQPPLERTAYLRAWAINMSNSGCALVLLGRRLRNGDGSTHLEDAVDAFREVLKEPAVRDMAPEYASLHVNLADALLALGERAMPDESLQFMARAVDSLAMALSVVAPEKMRWMVEAQRDGVC